MLRDILRDQLDLNLVKIRDTTSQAFTMSLIKRTECNFRGNLECVKIVKTMTIINS